MAEDAESAESQSQSDGESCEVIAAPAGRRVSPRRLAVMVCLFAIAALVGVSGWLGYETWQEDKAERQRQLYIQVARQGALNLTTIDHQQVDQDVTRILDSATGEFYEDFSQRSGPLMDVVRQVQSKSVGKVVEAGLESESENEAQVLVAVNVETSNAGAPEQQPRSWRMRLTVQKVGEDVKVSNVGFVP